MNKKGAKAILKFVDKAADVYYKDDLAGWLWVDEKAYYFEYAEEYCGMPNARPVSLTMPIENRFYSDNKLFPFFDNLIPEGWLLDIALDNWKLSSNDRFELLLATGKNTIGAVSVHPISLEDHD